MTVEDEFLADVDEVTTRMGSELQRVPGVIDGCCDALRILIFWDTDWVEARRTEAHTEFQTAQRKAEEATTFCTNVCGDVRIAKSLREAASFFDEIDFDALLTELETSNLVGGSGWESVNKPLYTAKVEPLKGKATSLADTLSDFVDALIRACDALRNWVIGGLAAVGGIILALIGLCTALAAGWTGVGAIIGLIVAIVSFTYAIAQLLLLSDYTSVIETESQTINDRASSVDGSQWPSTPALDAGNW